MSLTLAQSTPPAPPLRLRLLPRHAYTEHLRQQRLDPAHRTQNNRCTYAPCPKIQTRAPPHSDRRAFTRFHPQPPMAIKKSELYRSLWDSCDALRGGMDASQYKDYILVLLFVKYVSDRSASDPGFLFGVPTGASFADMAALKGNPHIGDKMNKIVRAIDAANDLRHALWIADFNDSVLLGSGKEMVDKLSKLVAIFENADLDFTRHRAGDDDLLGDAYEYLMRHFATESGKSKGQFYTPAEVSRIMARLIGIEHATSPKQTLYDPTCGSGSLLIKAADQAPVDVSIYGQEMDVDTAGLARMNMILHGHPTAEIEQGNTLAQPKFRDAQGALKRFDFAVANPPFSFKNWAQGVTLPDVRFADGIPPAKNGDYAFLQHLLASLNSTGKGAIIMPHGVLFRGNAEANIRREIVRKGYIKGIIGLPPNLFYGTGIPACIIVLDKANARTRTGIFFIDASRGFMKDGPKNRLRHQDVHKIVDVFTTQAEVPGYARRVTLAEIEANDFNLNIPRYIDGSEPEDLQDIGAHLHGGLPVADIDALAAWWQQFPGLRAQLFAANGRPGYSELAVAPAAIKQTITTHPEFFAWQQASHARVDGWLAWSRPQLAAVAQGDSPRALGVNLAEGLLARFVDAPLLVAYDLYQRFMTYWSDTLQDDLYLVAADGWQKAARLRLLVPRSADATPEKPDLVIGRQKYIADLIPPALVVNRFFASEQKEIDDLGAQVEECDRQLEEMGEEHGGEEGLLAAVSDDKGKITKTAVNARLKELRADADDEDAAAERALLRLWLGLVDERSRIEAERKQKQGLLDAALYLKYSALSVAEVQTLAIDDKWFADLKAAMEADMQRVGQALTARVQQLADRYATPLPALTAEVESLSAKVAAHLESMGFAWN